MQVREIYLLDLPASSRPAHHRSSHRCGWGSSWCPPRRSPWWSAAPPPRRPASPCHSTETSWFHDFWVICSLQCSISSKSLNNLCVKRRCKKIKTTCGWSINTILVSEYQYHQYWCRPPTLSLGISRSSDPCFRKTLPAVCWGLIPIPSSVMMALQ